MTDSDDEKDSLSPHPFGMPDHRQVNVWLIVGVVAVAVVLLAGAVITYLVLLPQPSQDGATPAAPGATPRATSPTSPQPAIGQTATAGESSSTPGGGSQGAPPTQTAPPGAALTTITVQPAETVALIVVPRGFAGADFNVVFAPYGRGPTGPAGGVLVVKVTQSKPVGAAAVSLKRDFADKNLALYCDQGCLSAVRAGGSYRGVVRVRPQGDVGVLLLVQVTPVR